MKKTIIALMALAGIASAAAPEWSAVQTDPTHVTYTTTQTGSFTFDSLGDAAISNGESFTLTMRFTCTSNPFVQGNALSFLAAKAGSQNDLYDIGGEHNQFRLYIRPGDEFVQLSINGYNYGHNTGGNNSEYYTSTLPAVVSQETPVTLAFQFIYLNDADAPDGDSDFTFASLPESQIQLSISDHNIVKTFNFSDLTNYTGSYNNCPADMVTTISITKAGQLPIDPTPSIPEPTTATLSLLALAGLAARRRRASR